MIDGAGSAGATRHPWLAALAAQPEQEVRRLMAGQAAIWPFHGADLPDAVALLLGQLEQGDEALKSLDLGLLKWLEAQRSQRPRDARDDQAQVLRAIDALDMVARVRLDHCVSSFWSDYVKWYSWADQHDLAPNADLRAAFLRTLALTQERLDGAVHERHIPFWLDVCSRAGRSYPDPYIDLGLLGLRCLPLPPLPEGEVSNASLCVTGLTRWATARHGLWRDFSWRWLAMKHAFPRYHDFWPDLFEQVVFPHIGEFEREFYRAWAENAQFKRAKHDREARAAKPKKEEVLAFAATIAKLPPNEALSKAIGFVEQRERYAQETGVTVDVAKAACYLGHRLLRDAKGPIDRRAAVALDFAMTSLRWAPQDTHGWALWRDALFACDRRADAELVAWESIGRFPHMAVLADNLSQLWLQEGRIDDAKALLRENVARNNDVMSRTLLVTILLRTNVLADVKEAERLVRIGVAEGNVFSRNILAGLLLRRRSAKDLEEAEALLRETLDMFDNVYARTMLSGFLMRRRDWDEAEKLLRHDVMDKRNVITRKLLARLLLARGNEGDLQDAIDFLRVDAGTDPEAGAMLHALAPDNDRVESLVTPKTSDDLNAGVAISGIEPELSAQPGENEVRPIDSENVPDSDEAFSRTQEDEVTAEADEQEHDAILDDVIGAVVTDFRRQVASSRGGPQVGHVDSRKEAKRDISSIVPSVALEGPPDNYMMALIRPFARTRQSAFFYAHGSAAKKDEAEELLTKSAEGDDLALARFFLLGLQPWRKPDSKDLNSGAFGLALLAALRAASLEKVDRLEERHPQELFACRVVRSMISGGGDRPNVVPGKEVDSAAGQLGPASSILLQLEGARQREPIQDNELQLIAALGAAFLMPIAA